MVPLDAHSSALVMTFNIERDCEWLQALAKAPLAYFGAIGSRAFASEIKVVTPPPGGMNLSDRRAAFVCA